MMKRQRCDNRDVRYLDGEQFIPASAKSGGSNSPSGFARANLPMLALIAPSVGQAAVASFARSIDSVRRFSRQGGKWASPSADEQPSRPDVAVGRVVLLVARACSSRDRSPDASNAT
jgi:hypothetical protein